MEIEIKEQGLENLSEKRKRLSRKRGFITSTLAEGRGDAHAGGISGNWSISAAASMNVGGQCERLGSFSHYLGGNELAIRPRRKPSTNIVTETSPTSPPVIASPPFTMFFYHQK